MGRFGIFATCFGICCAAAIGAWAAATPVAPFSADDSRLLNIGDAERGRIFFALGDCASRPSPGNPIGCG